MKIKKVIFVTVFILSILTITGCENNHNTQKPPSVNIERMEHSVKSDNDDVLAVIYFDKPVLSGESEVILKINEYFDTEYNNWLNGIPNRLNGFRSDEMSWFWERINSGKESFGEAALIRQPLKYTINTELTFLDNNILSLKQFVLLSAGGPNSFYCYGSTFDLKTGEVLPFTYFYDVDADDFRNSLADFLIDNKVDSFLSDSEITQIIGANSEHNFDYEDDDHQWNFAYEYYYDGSSIYLNLNQISIHSGYIVKWNGRTGDQFEASIWRYNKKDDAFEEHQVYPVTTGVNPS